MSEEIIKNEYDYEKESKKGETEIINNFYKYIGIGADSKYKNKMKTNKINRFYKFIKNYKIDVRGNEIQSIKGKLIKNKKRNNLSSSKHSINKILSNDLKNYFSSTNEKRLMRISSSSKKNVMKKKYS